MGRDRQTTHDERQPGQESTKDDEAAEVGVNGVALFRPPRYGTAALVYAPGAEGSRSKRIAAIVIAMFESFHSIST